MPGHCRGIPTFPWGIRDGGDMQVLQRQQPGTALQQTASSSGAPAAPQPGALLFSLHLPGSQEAWGANTNASEISAHPMTPKPNLHCTANQRVQNPAHCQQPSGAKALDSALAADPPCSATSAVPPGQAVGEGGSAAPGKAAPVRASPTRNPTYPCRAVPPANRWGRHQAEKNTGTQGI